jgi:phosphomannomutase
MTNQADLPKGIFRAYDIRGVYPREINESVCLTVAMSLGQYFKSKQKQKRKKTRVVVGHDARISSPKLYRAVIRGLKESQVFPIEAGLISTPMLYFLVNDLQCNGGIVVTASHNPPEFNGLKVVGKKAVPVMGQVVYLMATSGITI